MKRFIVFGENHSASGVFLIGGFITLQEAYAAADAYDCDERHVLDVAEWRETYRSEGMLRWSPWYNDPIL